mgnify:CR=1 FL=1
MSFQHSRDSNMQNYLHEDRALRLDSIGLPTYNNRLIQLFETQAIESNCSSQFDGEWIRSEEALSSHCLKQGQDLLDLIPALVSGHCALAKVETHSATLSVLVFAPPIAMAKPLAFVLPSKGKAYGPRYSHLAAKALGVFIPIEGNSYPFNGVVSQTALNMALLHQIGVACLGAGATTACLFGIYGAENDSIAEPVLKGELCRHSLANTKIPVVKICSTYVNSEWVDVVQAKSTLIKEALSELTARMVSGFNFNPLDARDQVWRLDWDFERQIISISAAIPGTNKKCERVFDALTLTDVCPVKEVA